MRRVVALSTLIAAGCRSERTEVRADPAAADVRPDEEIATRCFRASGPRNGRTGETPGEACACDYPGPRIRCVPTVFRGTKD